jgi:NADH:ubiquinone oxidoreductase subunit 6 (subunit J)
VLLAGPAYRVVETNTGSIWRQLGAIGASALLLALAYAAFFGNFHESSYFGGDFGAAAIGRRLFAHDALATEAVAALVLVALVGAAAVWRTRDRSR